MRSSVWIRSFGLIIDEVENTENRIHGHYPWRFDAGDDFRGIAAVAFHHPDAAVRAVRDVQILTDPIDGHTTWLYFVLVVFGQEHLRIGQRDGTWREMCSIELKIVFVDPIEHAIVRIDGHDADIVHVFNEHAVMRTRCQENCNGGDGMSSRSEMRMSMDRSKRRYH